MWVPFASTIQICLCFIKVIVLAPTSVCFSTTAIYLSSCSFMSLCVPFYCHACLCLLHCMCEGRRYTILYFHPLFYAIKWFMRLTDTQLTGDLCTSNRYNCPRKLFYLYKILRLMVRSVTWNRFPIKNVCNCIQLSCLVGYVYKILHKNEKNLI